MSLSSELRAAMLAGDCGAVDGDALTGFCDAIASVLEPRFGTPRTTAQTLTASSGNFAIDPNDGTHITLTLTGSLTSLTMLALDLEEDTGSTIKLEIIQGGSGGNAIASWIGFGFIGGIPPTLATSVDQVNVVTAVLREGGPARFVASPKTGTGFLE